MPLIVFVWLFEVQLKPFVFLSLELSHLFVSQFLELLLLVSHRVHWAKLPLWTLLALLPVTVNHPSFSVALFSAAPFSISCNNDPDLRLVV